MNLPRGIRSPIRSEGARLTKSVVSKAPLMKRREEDEASTAKTPRRHRSDEEEQEIERRALTTPPPDGQEEQEIERRALTTPPPDGQEEASATKIPRRHRPDEEEQEIERQALTAPPPDGPPLQSEDSHAKTPSPREDAKNVVYPTEELKDAADTPLMSQWREREKLLELMEGRIPHPESSSPLLQSSSRATKNQKIYRTPKGPFLPSRLLPRRHRKCKSRRALTPLQMKGLQKDPPNLKSTIQEKPPPSKKKGKKFQLPREGPQEERREVPATPRRTRPQSPKSGRQQIGRNQIQACLPSPDIETDDPAATPHKERNSALNATWPSGSPKTEISRRLQLIVSGPCPRLMTP